jgi:hypothetical protein
MRKEGRPKSGKGPGWHDAIEAPILMVSVHNT